MRIVKFVNEALTEPNAWNTGAGRAPMVQTLPVWALSLWTSVWMVGNTACTDSIVNPKVNV